MSQRSIRLVTTPPPPREHSPGMANRPLIAPGSWADFDPFLVLMEDWMREPGGFPDHPHRGIETVTFVVDGELHHADNRGNSGVLGADDVQWMTAGRGIIHAELPNQDHSSHTLQLWLNLPSARKMVESAYQDLLATRAVALDDDRARIRLISGDIEGISSPTVNQTPVQYLDVRLADDAGGRAVLPVPASHNGFVVVLEGEVSIGSERVLARPGQVAWLGFPLERRTGLSRLEIRAEAPARVLVVSGEPIRESVVAYGPFVMNTEAEIVQAYHDFHSGKFGGPTPVGQAVLT
jgi:quercetin 2,3-dioxygenase